MPSGLSDLYAALPRRMVKHMTWKMLLAAAAAVALLASPASAGPAGKHHQAARAKVAYAQRVGPMAGHAVYAPNGEYLGADPDPFIRAQLYRDAYAKDASGP